MPSAPVSTPTRSRRSSSPAIPSLDPVSPGASSSNGEGLRMESLDEMMNLGNNAVAGQKIATAETRRLSVAKVQEIEATIEKMGGSKSREGIREKILAADYAAVNSIIKEDEADIAKAMEALQEIAGTMDIKFQQLNEPSADEKAVVDAAKAAVAKAEANIVAAQAQLGKANAKWLFKGSAIAAANEAIAEAESQLRTAKEEVPKAERQVQSLIRERLRNANMDESIKTLIMVSRKTVEILKASVVKLGEQITSLEAGRIQALKHKEEAAAKLREIDARLADQELELRQLEDELSTKVNGTIEHGQLEEKISNLRVQVENTRGDKAVAMTRFQAKEVGAKDIALHQLSLMKQRDVNRARITRTVSETETREKTYAARLAGMQVQSEQKFDEQIGVIGTKTDSDSRMFMAMSMVASGDALMKNLEAQPEKLNEIHQVLKTMAEHLATMNARGAAVDEKMRNNAGINSLETSVFNYTDPAAPASTPVETNGSNG